MKASVSCNFTGARSALLARSKLRPCPTGCEGQAGRDGACPQSPQPHRCARIGRGRAAAQQGCGDRGPEGRPWRCRRRPQAVAGSPGAGTLHANDCTDGVPMTGRQGVPPSSRCASGRKAVMSPPRTLGWLVVQRRLMTQNFNAPCHSHEDVVCGNGARFPGLTVHDTKVILNPCSAACDARPSLLP